MFCEDEDVELSEQVSPIEFYCLKALITLEQVNISVIKKEEELLWGNFGSEANWSGVVNSHCMQISLVMNMQFFWR